MVEAVWVASGTSDPGVGLKLIELLYRTGREDRARSIVFQVLDSPDVQVEVVVECINRAIDAKDYRTADRLIDERAAKLADNPDFQTARASLIVSREDVSGAKGFFESSEIRPASLFAKQPSIYARLLMLAGRREELEATLRNSLDEVIENGGPEAILNFYHVYTSIGKSDEFRDMVKKRLSPSRAERILGWLPGQSRPRVRPALSSKTEDFMTF